jgi:hypothetical protein
MKTFVIGHLPLFRPNLPRDRLLPIAPFGAGAPDYRNTLRFLSRSTLASSTIVRLATFHAPFTWRSTSSRQPERS